MNEPTPSESNEGVDDSFVRLAGGSLEESSPMDKLRVAQKEGNPEKIQQAQARADEAFALRVGPTSTKVVEMNEQELISLEEIKEKITKLNKSILPLTEEENDILQKRQREWFNSEEGKQASQQAYKDKVDSRDLFLKEKYPALLKKIEERRIVDAEIRGWEQQAEDIETTNLASDPRIIGLITMSGDEALRHIKAIRRHGMGDYYGFQISGKDYVASTKAILADPTINEDEKLKKIAELYSLIGGYQHGYIDNYEHLTRLTEEQKEKIIKIAHELG